MIKIKKKYIIGILLLIVVLLIATGITHAYYIDSQEKINKVNIGSSEIEITENFPKPPPVLQAGETYTKEVSVKNLKAESWIRMRVEVNNSEIEKLLTINFTDLNWVKESDGYYYYTIPVKTGETTKPILNSITVHNNIPSGSLNIICYAESVQAEGNKIGSKPYVKAFEKLKSKTKVWVVDKHATPEEGHWEWI